MMHENRHFLFRGAVVAAVSCLCMAGCGGGGIAKPSADTARSSLEVALNSWKASGSPGVIAGSDPPTQVVDSSWQSGRKLESFEILQEYDGGGDRRFTVRLKHPEPTGEEEVHYVVLGEGPVWVYRDEDFQRMIHMDNNPAPPRGKAPSRRSPRS